MVWTRVSNQLEARTASWHNSWHWLQLINFHPRPTRRRTCWRAAEWKLLSWSHVKSWVNLSWPGFGLVVYSCAANQEKACLLTHLLTMTTTHKFPSLPSAPLYTHWTQQPHSNVKAFPCRCLQKDLRWTGSTLSSHLQPFHVCITDRQT